MTLICKRTVRHSDAAGKVMARDLRILDLLALTQPVTTRQVQTWIQSSDQAARRRLRFSSSLNDRCLR